MKKLIISAVIILCICIFGAPYMTGKLAEDQVPVVIDQLNQESQDFGNHEILSYERSAFSSESKYRYTLPGVYQTIAETTSIDYQCELDHGIIGIDYSCELSDNPELTKFIDTYFAGKNPVSMHGNINIFGKLTQTITVDEINDLKLDDTSDTISMAKSFITVNTDKDLASYLILGESDNVSIVSDGETMSMNDLVIGGDMSKLESGLFAGYITAEVSKMELQNDENTISLEGFKFKTDTKELSLSIWRN